MADLEGEGRSMSIVPYNYSREVVLRHNDAVVVYDRTSQQLQLQDASQTDAELDLPRLCPYCHRPLLDENESDIGSESRRAPTATGYVDPNYFSMLGSNQSPPASRPGSSRNQLTPYVVDEGDEDNAVNSLSPAGISRQSFNDGFFKRNFIEERVLGKGGKGIVMLVKHVLGSNDLGQFACKRVPVGDSPEWLRKVLVEVQTLKQLSHHNLAPYHHAWLEHAKVSNFGPTVPCVFILQRYCEAGDLHQYVCGPTPTQDTPQKMKARMRRRSKGEPEPPSGLVGPRKLGIEMIYSFFKDINSGLRYLHNKNLIHRDLKPSNCLLTLEGNKLRAVVSDFGEVQSEEAVRASTGGTGTVSYCAPEVLRRVAPHGPYGNFTYKSDIFSLGMILYFLCFASLPYIHSDIINEDNEDLDQLRDEICQWAGFNDAQRLRPELPDKLYWLLARLLSLNSDKRPTAQEIFELMKKHNNWDIASEDRRPSFNSSLEMPHISPVHSDQSGSASPIAARDSVSPRTDKGSSGRIPELEGLTSETAITGQDYGTMRNSSDRSSPEIGGDGRSLILSKKVHFDPYASGNSDNANQYCPEHPREYSSGQESRHTREGSYERPDGRFDGFAGEHIRPSPYRSPRERGRQHTQGHGQEGKYGTEYGFNYIFNRRGDWGRRQLPRTTTEDSVDDSPGQHSHLRIPGESRRDDDPGSLNLEFWTSPGRRNFVSRRFLAFPFNWECLNVFCSHPIIADLVAFAVFLLKIFSITVPCSPQAAQPWIFYPLLILATVDFGLISFPFHVFALLCHALTVGFAVGWKTLCVGA